jgi:hypothetical protein
MRSKDAVRCYIVRVYGRTEGDLDAIKGVIETVGRAGQRAFGSVSELFDMLRQTIARRSAPRKTDRSSGPRVTRSQSKAPRRAGASRRRT